MWLKITGLINSTVWITHFLNLDVFIGWISTKSWSNHHTCTKKHKRLESNHLILLWPVCFAQTKYYYLIDLIFSMNDKHIHVQFQDWVNHVGGSCYVSFIKPLDWLGQHLRTIQISSHSFSVSNQSRHVWQSPISLCLFEILLFLSNEEVIVWPSYVAVPVPTHAEENRSNKIPVKRWHMTLTLIVIR